MIKLYGSISGWLFDDAEGRTNLRYLFGIAW